MSGARRGLGRRAAAAAAAAACLVLAACCAAQPMPEPVPLDLEPLAHAAPEALPQQLEDLASRARAAGLLADTLTLPYQVTLPASPPSGPPAPPGSPSTVDISTSATFFAVSSPAAADPALPLLFLFPGFNVQPKQYSRLVERLAGEGFTVVAPKVEHPLPFPIPGLPRPGCPDAYLVPTAGLLSTFLSSLDAAKALPAMQAANTDELVLLGHSVGGAAALLVAAGCPPEQDEPISCAGYQSLNQTELRGVVVYEAYDEDPLLLDPSLFVLYLSGADSSPTTLQAMQDAYLNTTTSADAAAAAANATLSGLDGPADAAAALAALPPAAEPAAPSVGVAVAAPAAEAALLAGLAAPAVEPLVPLDPYAGGAAAILALPPMAEPPMAEPPALLAAVPLAAPPAQEPLAPAAEPPLNITMLTPEERGCVGYVVFADANHFGITDYWVSNATEGQAAPCARVSPGTPAYVPSQEAQEGNIDLAAALTGAAIQAALGDPKGAETLSMLAAEPGVAAARLPPCMSPP